MSAPTSKPVHPCITSVFDGSRGAEYSTWAHLTTRPPECPNLVTGQASTIRVYTLDEETGKLFETYVFSNLAGNICYLQTLRASDYHGGEISKDSKNVIRDRDNLPNTSYGDDDDQKHADALLLGFCGHPRLTVVSLTHQADSASSPALLSATCLMDLTQALIDSSFGSVTPLEHDLVAATGARKNNDGATVAVILGAGVAVAVIDLQRSSRSGWIAHEPYLLPLPSLSASIKRSHSANSQAQSSNPASAAAASAVTNTNIASIATGFGDILSATFLAGYIEPTLVLLHSNPNQHGRTWIGRMGRPHWQPGTRHGLLVTAFSVTVAHKRSAILWSVEVPADARSLYPVGKSGCLVLCTNSLLSINNAGRIDDFLGVNGFVKSTCPTSLLEILKPNPKPFPKLSTQLDGAALSFCTENTVLLSLRSGRLYLLQLPSSDPAERNGQSRMSLLPMGRTLGAIGSVSSLVAWPLATAGQELFDKLGTKMIGGGTDKAKEKLSMGLLFAGSRLGDSSLLGYVLEYLTVPWEGDEESDTKRIKHDDATTDANAETAISQPGLQRSETKSFSLLDEIPYRVSPEMDEILRLEEEALYAPTNVDNQADSNVVPPSDEEDAREHLPPLQSSSNMTMKPSQSGSSVTTKRKLPPVSETVILRALTSLDSLVGLGPLGPSCEGPIAYPDVQTSFSTGVINPATALIMPCGYGSSGGLCILTAPGRDERHILAEEDCLEVQSMFSLRNHNLVFLGMKSGMGVRVLRLNQGEAAGQSEKPENETLVNSDLSEVSVDEWCKPSKKRRGKDTPSASELFSNAALLACADFVDGSFMLVMSYPKDRENPKDLFYGGAVLKDVSGTLEVLASFSLPSQDGNGALNSIAPMAIDKDNFGKPVMLLACCWSSGLANLVAVDNSGIIKNVEIPVSEGGMQPMDEDDDDDDDSDHAINAFYSSTRVVAVDLFCVSANYFEGPSEDSEKSKGDFEGSKQTKSSTASDMEILLAGDQDLYYVSDHSDSSGNDQTLMERGAEGTESWKDEALFLGVCRQSGSLQVFSVSDFLLSTKDQVAVWACEGCGLGAMSLCSNGEHRTPKQHEVCVREMRFFFCGPSAEPGDQNNLSPSRPLCLSLETSNGDLIVYSAENRSNPSLELRFNRAPLKLIARESQEQTRFRAKLRRKGIVSSSVDADESYFRYNRLNRFTSLSEQDGLFAATCRPVWVVAERGKPQAIVHRSRHVAPAGGKSRPVTGFCADLDGEGGFMTLHERVGSVGSQRLTLYRSVSSMFQSEGLIPGGGFCIEKIPLGVTVRRIQFIDDESVSSGGRCLYAVLVSRDIEADMSHLNDDGMTPEERDRIEQEKEAAKIKRQVEADLGGFDVEQEWVEEIEREDCFQVDKDLGGAPPLPQSCYSLWIVDAANRWVVVDSYELGEFEHGMTMNVMSLTDFPDEPGSTTTEETSIDDLDTKLFVTLGVGIVDKNGEDVSSKGKVLLFEVKVPEESSRISSQAAELELVYEKDIFHGPVTTLTCLSSEGTYRLIIGAGADVNVEQWGNGKLTQVGFFRATMHILEIQMFKDFLLLSDAYDSLYFLVWRESDKSLTLLSKEYDPLAVYAAGTMSRGGALTFVCQDDRQNVQFFQYAPGEAAARGGNKLVSRADFHLGSHTSAFHNHVCRSSLWINSATPSSTLAALKQQDTFYGRADDDQRLGAHFGTSDGGFGSIVPLSEPVYWRLTALQSVMANALESDCALSHKAWRLYRRSYRRGGCRSNDRKKGVIDGDLVMRYADLPLPDQEDLASSIGSTVDLILDNLLEIKCANMVI